MIPELTLTLALQALLTLFAPPISAFGRSLYLGDLWCFVWVLGAVGYWGCLKRSFSKGLWIYLAITAVLIAVAFLRGPYRVSITSHVEQFYRSTDLRGAELPNDHFEAGRELVIALRFLSWLWAAGILSVFLREDLSQKDRVKVSERVFSLLAGVFVVLGAVSLAAKLFPGFHTWLGSLYLYDPNYVFWRPRIYGVFPSPIEAGVAAAFGGLLLAALPRSTSQKRLFLAGESGAALVLLLSGTFTALAVLLAFGGLWVFRKIWRSKFRMQGLLLLGFTAVFLMIAAWIDYHRWMGSFTYIKVTDLLMRLKPWEIQIAAGFAHWDSALLGTGFGPLHSDNVYVFLFGRGGLLWLGTFLFAVSTWLRRNWRLWSPWQRLVPLFLLTSGLALDSLILRATAMLAFAFAPVALLPKRQ